MRAGGSRARSNSYFEHSGSTPEQPFRALWCLWRLAAPEHAGAAISSVLTAPEQARAAMSSAQWHRSRFEQPFRAPSVAVAVAIAVAVVVAVAAAVAVAPGGS